MSETQQRNLQLHVMCREWVNDIQSWMRSRFYLVAWGWVTHAGRYYHHLWEHYKLNGEGFERLWREQDGRCACGREFAHPTRRRMQMGYQPQVDHEHKKDISGNELACQTEDVRGLLCQRCNRLLGLMRDNIDILGGLLAYLQKHGGLRL